MSISGGPRDGSLKLALYGCLRKHNILVRGAESVQQVLVSLRCVDIPGPTTGEGEARSPICILRQCDSEGSLAGNYPRRRGFTIEGTEDTEKLGRWKRKIEHAG